MAAPVDLWAGSIGIDKVEGRMPFASSRSRWWESLATGSTALLMTGSAAVVYAANQRPAADLRTPIGVAQRFVEVALVTHEEGGAIGVTCNPSRLDIYDLRWQLAGVEEKHHVTSEVTFSGWKLVEADRKASVTVRIAIRFAEAPERDDTQEWTLNLQHADKWRVCSTDRVDNMEG